MWGRCYGGDEGRVKGIRMDEEVEGEARRRRGRGWIPRIRRPLHNRHSGTRAGIQGWKFRIEPHVYSAQHGLSSVVMQRSPFARTTGGEGAHEGRPYGGKGNGGPGEVSCGEGGTGLV